MEAHRHWAIRQFARSAAVLALHADRVIAFLGGKAGVVYNPERLALLLAGGGGPLLPHRFPGPGAWADKR
jgi:hypothetical protein